MGAPLLIAGIDPGTTAAYALINLSGNVVKLHSAKNLDKNTLIKQLVREGKILVVAGDKEKHQEFVETIATKLGARLAGPEYDLKVEEKRMLAKNFKTRNQHEIDALAAAILGLRSIKPLLKKIEIFLEIQNKPISKNRFTTFVVTEGLSLKDAAEVLTEKPKLPERKLEETFIIPAQIKNLRNKIKRATKENEILKDQNKNLNKQILNLKSEFAFSLEKSTRNNQDKQMKRLVQFKEERIRYFERLAQKKDRIITRMEESLATVFYFLSQLGEYTLIKKLENLGYHDFQKQNKILHIKDRDIILVKNTDIVSKKTIDYLKDKVELILYQKPISKAIEQAYPFIFLNAKKLPLEEHKYFAIAQNKDIQALKQQQNILAKVITDYRRERVN